MEETPRIEWTETQQNDVWVPVGGQSRERQLEGALNGLMAFVGQLTPEEFCDAIYERNQHLDLTEKWLILENLKYSIGWAWHALSLEKSA